MKRVIEAYGWMVSLFGFVLLGLAVFGFSGAGFAAQQVVTFEENNSAWSYSGYWRDSNQGHYGSNGNYAVGRGAETNTNSYSGESGAGVAILDLMQFQGQIVTVEFCYVSHGNTYRSAENSLTISTVSGDTSFSFSQRGTTNQKVCFDAGQHSGISSLSFSNVTPDSKWLALDFVNVSVEESLPPVDDGKPIYQSSFEPGDLIPNLPMGTNLQRTVFVDASALGITFETNSNTPVNFGELIIPLDDLDNNGIRELYVSIDWYRTEYSFARAIIVFPDANGNILKHQVIDGSMTRNTTWYPGYDAYFGAGAGDFDSNGVKDIVLSQNAGMQQNRFNVLMFGRNNDSTEALYTIVGDVEFSNNRGDIPFQILKNNSFGAWAHAIGDIDGNGTGDFWSVFIDSDKTFRPDIPNRGLHTTLFTDPDGTHLSYESDVLPDFSSNQKIIGDINGDGIPDLVMQEHSAQQNFFLTTLVSNSSSGNFTKKLTQITKQGFSNHMRINNSTAVGDANGDGNLDVIVSAYPNYKDLTVTTTELVYLDENQDQLGDPVTLVDRDDLRDGAFYTYSPAVLDLDGDGDLDLAFPSPRADNGGGFYLLYYQ